MSRIPLTQPLITTNETAQESRARPISNETVMEDRQSIADLLDAVCAPRTVLPVAQVTHGSTQLLETTA